jgi:hypothetical protein
MVSQAVKIRGQELPHVGVQEGVIQVDEQGLDQGFSDVALKGGRCR